MDADLRNDFDYCKAHGLLEPDDCPDGKPIPAYAMHYAQQRQQHEAHQKSLQGFGWHETCDPKSRRVLASQESAQDLFFGNQLGSMPCRKKNPHVFMAPSEEAKTVSRRLKPDEVMTVLPKRLGRLRLNLRTGDVHTENDVLSGNHIGRLYLQLSSPAEIWSKEPTADAVALLASQDPFDPVADYLNNINIEPLPLEQWRRLDQNLFGIDDPIAAEFLPRYLVAAVARVLKPGCPLRQTPVLVGPQWRGKTALGRILFGPNYWVEGIGELGRDDLMKAHTAWGVELAELDGLTRRSDQERLKAFLTETTDTYRKPYDRAPERHDRRFVFWATSNGPPLRDATGSTRFVVISLPDQMLPLDWVEQNRDAIWARALQQYRAGMDWNACSEAERQAIAERNSNYQEIDPWGEIITPHLERWRTENPLQPVLNQQLYRWLGIDASRQNNSAAVRLRALMLRAGWSWERRRQGKQRGAWAWWPAA